MFTVGAYMLRVYTRAHALMHVYVRIGVYSACVGLKTAYCCCMQGEVGRLSAIFATPYPMFLRFLVKS